MSSYHLGRNRPGNNGVQPMNVHQETVWLRIERRPCWAARGAKLAHGWPKDTLSLMRCARPRRGWRCHAKAPRHLRAAYSWSLAAAVSWHSFEAGTAEGVFSLAVLIPSTLNSRLNMQRRRRRVCANKKSL